MVAYQVGLPGWKLAAFLKLPLKATAQSMFDKKAQVYIATCEDFLPRLGVATEAETTEKLKERLDDLLEEAINETFGKQLSVKVILVFELTTALWKAEEL